MGSRRDPDGDGRANCEHGLVAGELAHGLAARGCIDATPATWARSQPFSGAIHAVASGLGEPLEPGRADVCGRGAQRGINADGVRDGAVAACHPNQWQTDRYSLFSGAHSSGFMLISHMLNKLRARGARSLARRCASSVWLSLRPTLPSAFPQRATDPSTPPHPPDQGRDRGH